MRFFGFSTLAVLLLSACSGAPAPGRDPVSTVEAIYAPYVENVANPPSLENAAPWTGDLETLIEAAAEVDGGIGFDPIIDGQEYEVAGLQVTSADGATDTAAEVTAAFTNLGDPVTVTYDLVQEGGGWRVRDVRTDSWTLRGALASVGVTPERVAGEETP
jgi:hypothetical protein